jgi:hypothetical protein
MGQARGKPKAVWLSAGRERPKGGLAIPIRLPGPLPAPRITQSRIKIANSAAEQDCPSMQRVFNRLR